ncbi:hypothetical protein JR316_0010302 [Psilocybe cubensis]|uniref:Uncharacterized protein n=1 Tax=Psilocybe cubensis TaxID=181762 RepID=A0ACB8GRG9_PSICU|nr:hypothetical protein JR316_0010302 [Psilocybe cubensis]KAH9478065.1 hypothetical protein JR316_0010302 [Psilocybe cubensis]
MRLVDHIISRRPLDRSFLAIADVVFLVCLPEITLNWIFEAVLAKIYAIQLLSTLNARDSLNKVWDDQLNKFCLEAGSNFVVSMEPNIATPDSGSTFEAVLSTRQPTGSPKIGV